MRRIADLTPGSARTDRRDAAVIAQAARTMPHTLRDVTAADEEAASLTMPAGSGPGPGAPGRPRPRAASGACTTQTPPRPRGRPGTPPGPRRGPGGHSGLAHPHRTEEGRQGTYRCQAEEARSPAPCRLGPAGLRSPEEADRDGGRHRRGRGGPAPPGPPGSSPCTLRGPSTATRPGALAGGSTLSCPVPTTRARDRGPGRRRLPGRDTGQDPRHRSPAGLLRRPGAGDQEVGVLDQGREASPTQATSGSRQPCSAPPSPPCAPTPSAAPTTSANETRQTPGPSRHSPGPPPRPDPARHDPKRHPLRSTASSTATHRRLTHHIGAPPGPVRDGPGRPDANRIAHRLNSSGRFPGAGLILILPWIQTLEGYSEGGFEGVE